MNVMKTVFAGLISVCLVACSTPSATYASQSDDYSFSLDQDTPGGKFSSWMGHKPSSNGRLSASVTVTSPRPTDRWAPFVAVELCATRSCADVGRLEIGFDPEGTANVEVRNGGQVLRNRSIEGDFKIGEAIAIDLNWRGGDHMEARLNGSEAKRLNISFVPAAIRIISGSADVKVTDISVQ